MNGLETSFGLQAFAFYAWTALPVLLAYLVPEPTLEQYLESLGSDEREKLRKELNEKFAYSRESHDIAVVRLPREWTCLIIYPNGKYIFTIPKAKT